MRHSEFCPLPKPAETPPRPVTLCRGVSRAFLPSNQSVSHVPLPLRADCSMRDFDPKAAEQSVVGGRSGSAKARVLIMARLESIQIQKLQLKQRHAP